MRIMTLIFLLLCPGIAFAHGTHGALVEPSHTIHHVIQAFFILALGINLLLMWRARPAAASSAVEG